MSATPFLDELLALEREDLGAAACEEARVVLHRIAVGSECADASAPARVVALARAIYADAGIRLELGPDALDFRLAATLTRRRGACLGLVSIYVALGELLSLPLTPILLESHVRVELAAEPAPIVIETTRSGGILEARFRERIDGAQVPLRPSREEFLAVHRANRAIFVLLPTSGPVAAARELHRALEAFPTYPAGWLNLARLELGRGNDREAGNALDRALSLPLGEGFKKLALRLSFERASRSSHARSLA